MKVIFYLMGVSIMSNDIKKQIRKAYKENEQKQFEESLPMAEKLFPKLFDYIDNQLDKKACNHTLKNTQIFCKTHKLSNENEIIQWLNNNGAGCDCEVIYNVSEHFDWCSKLDLELPPDPDFDNILAKKQKINQLKTEFGFEIEKVPTPWKMSESVEGKQKTYFFQIGKGLNICLATLQTDSVADELNNDSFWLNGKGKKQVFKELERQEFQDFSIIIAKKENIRVKIWIIPQFDTRWHLELATENQRYKGDLKELEKLLSAIIKPKS